MNCYDKEITKAKQLYEAENLRPDNLEDTDIAAAITLKPNLRVKLRWLRMESSGKFL